ncbi:hypothetical protein [Desulfobaculum bizertense]|uniref:Uncharacterized protein n=1 Tax=Desulfobaculum bizertense DSM 18034 TaxID=1121442 RepID=A0A1T4VWU3_9BACT|nr:hypothetical protein [Desulfobaculum bizertense]SKA69295.1 hypothetical protein SAMN02745702_01093 [Desulfobaculum bizertense DSM 18034]
MHNPDLVTPEVVECHPLIRRLSGQVIWCMFEEYDANPGDIQAFLDRYDKRKTRTLEIIARAKSGDPTLAGIRLELTLPAKACPICRRLSGKFIPVSDERFYSFLPPFGLGCAARAVALSPEELKEQKAEDSLTDEELPPCELLCGDWIFTHPWSLETR